MMQCKWKLSKCQSWRVHCALLQKKFKLRTLIFYNINEVTHNTNGSRRKKRAQGHCLKLERRQRPPNINKMKQSVIVLSFKVSLLFSLCSHENEDSLFSKKKKTQSRAGSWFRWGELIATGWRAGGGWDGGGWGGGGWGGGGWDGGGWGGGGLLEGLKW